MNTGINDRVASLLAGDKNLKKSNRNQKSLAAAVGVAPGTLSGWLTKGREVPAGYIIPICDFFGVSPVWLLTGTNAPVVNAAADVSASALVQGVNHGTVSVGRSGRSMSEEEAELLRIYGSLDVKKRLKLLECAFALEDGEAGK